MTSLYAEYRRKFSKIGCSYTREFVYERVGKKIAELSKRDQLEVHIAYNHQQEKDDNIAVIESYSKLPHQIALNRPRVDCMGIILGRRNKVIGDKERLLECDTGGDMPFECRGIPEQIASAALRKFHLYLSGELRPRTTNKHKHKVIEIGMRYRLLIKSNKVLLLSHESYSKEINRA